MCGETDAEAWVQIHDGGSIRTSHGQRLYFVTRTWTCTDDIEAALDERFLREDDRTWRWLNSRQMLAATLLLDDGFLRIESNALERACAAEALLRDVLVELVDEDVVEPHDLADAARGHLVGAPPPEVIEAVREQIREMEQGWVDQPIPALEGRTPREALADPEHRDDVIELLRDFESREDTTGAGNGFRAARLRELLGI